MSFWGASTGTRVIHISTDCVFDGKEGPYDETRQHNALDEYGKSKSLGEPSDCMVLRTSIIGPEVPGKKKSLFEWVRAQKNGTVPGFINHFWNGLTTLELSNAIIKIIEYNYYSNGVFHLHSEDVTKANLVKSISDAFGFNVTIIPTEAPSICDRRLRSVKPLNSRIAPASLSKMLEELKSGK
jgi:dTDP-4-dehydrorhamnose reductase